MSRVEKERGGVGGVPPYEAVSKPTRFVQPRQHRNDASLTPIDTGSGRPL